MKRPLKQYTRECGLRNKTQKNIPVYSVTNSHGFVPSTDYFSKEVYSKDLSNYKIVSRGMIAYNPSRVNVGSLAVQNAEDKVIVSPLYVVFSVDESELMPEYVSYFLHSERGIKEIVAHTSGSVRDSLKFSALQDIEINICSLNEQAHIVSLLQKIERIIEKRRLVLVKIDDLVKSQFIEMFGDIVRNERKWPCESVEQVAPAVPYKGQIASSDGKFWLLNLDMVEAQTGEVISKVMVEPTEIGNSTTTFDRGNVLHSKLRPYLNKVVIPTESGYSTSELLPLRPNPGKLNRYYFASALRSDAFVGYIQEKVAGAKMPRVSMGVFRAFRIPCPPMLLQEQFARFVEQTDKSKIPSEMEVAA